MLAEFQTENATLEVRLWNIGTEKPLTSVTESGRLLTHVASMQRCATMNAEAFTPVAADCGDLDCDPHLDEDQNDSGLIAGSRDVLKGGIKMKAKGLNYPEEEKSNPYTERVYATILEDDDSTTDEMSIQKTFKGACTIMEKGDDLEKFRIQSANEFSIDWFERWFQKLHSLGIASLVAQEFGHMLQFGEVVGSPEELKNGKRIKEVSLTYTMERKCTKL